MRPPGDFDRRNNNGNCDHYDCRNGAAMRA